MTFASKWPSNMRMSKLTCTLKGVAPPEWLLDEDVLHVGSCWRIWEKLSIIAFLCHLGDFSSNILKGSLAPSSFLSFSIRGHQGLQGWSFKGSTGSSPNSLYPDLVGEMQRKIEKNIILSFSNSLNIGPIISPCRAHGDSFSICKSNLLRFEKWINQQVYKP